jgi:hypothetical protein
MRVRFVCLAGALALSLVDTGPAIAEVQGADSETPRVIRLFKQACMRYANNVSELREWTASHFMPKLSPAEAVAFVDESVGRRALVFEAAAASGKYVVVSYDNGTCQVVGSPANRAAVQQALLANLSEEGVSVVPDPPNAEDTGARFHASIALKHWSIVITTRDRADGLGGASELRLTAKLR